MLKDAEKRKVKQKMRFSLDRYTAKIANPDFMYLGIKLVAT